MVQTMRCVVFATSFLSGMATLLLLIALGTEQWVVAKGEFTLGVALNDQLSTIKYGLFSGTFIQVYEGKTNFEIKMTCLVSKNVCAYLCGASDEQRKEELRRLYHGENVEFNTRCPRVLRSHFDPPKIIDRANRIGERRVFLNAALYISTTIFLSLSIIFGLIATALSFWNTVANPIEFLFSIYGLYLYNGIAWVGCIFVMTLYGIFFGTTVIYNVGILYTIRGQMNTTGWADLGFSYWLVLPSCLLFTTSIIALYTRHYLISQDTKMCIQAEDKDAGDVMIY